MKFKQLLIIPVALALFAITSCSDSYLEGKQSDKINGNDLNKSLFKVGSSYLNGAYLQLFDSDLRVYHDDFSLRAIYFANDAMTDDMVLVNGFMFNYDYQNDNRSLNFRRTKSTWGQLYKIIYTANSALGKFNSIAEADLTDNVKVAIAECKTLRAYCYYILINLYQQPYSVNKNALGIPIITDTESKKGRNTVAEVYDVILKDLKEAYAELEGKGNTAADRINEYTTAGILAKVLCFVNDYPNQWTEVAKYADLASKGKPLTTAPTSDLLYGYNSIDKPEIMWGSRIDDETTTYYASFFSCMDPYAIGYAGMGRFICISSELFNEMQKNPKDVRTKWFLEADKPKASGVGKDTIPKYGAIKFRDKGGFASDYIYMRSPEMHYIKAEALFLAGNEAGARSALETVSKTRISGYSAASKVGSDLLQEIRIQKRIETWGDGVRLFDMKWRGEALDRGKSTNHVQNYTLSLPANPKEWIYQIPQSELDTNSEITENNL